MESIQRKQFNSYIEKFEFDLLFNQLGWNFVDNTFPKKAGDKIFQFRHIAEKAGFAILECLPDLGDKIPEAQIRKRIHTEIAKLHHEHLIIFVDDNKTMQQWELLVREPNKPIRTVSHKWISGQAPELLYQKLSGAFFSIAEDEAGTLTIVDVVQRIKDNFGKNAEKVTKKFYIEFKNQHSAFLDFIKGIEDTIPHKKNSNKQWYASLMLNRLMFCYFIQKKGFLDQDKSYLRNKLRACQALSGTDRFYSFYRSFLLELFHDGLGRPINRRNDDLPIELGNIPYLNGGLFDVHELEYQFGSIQIDDSAFEQIFDFFDKWEWHLDTREHTEGRTINPDVIGYIFEKYINDRASMGAYYTKEDITDYISKNTILPFLFDETERNYKRGFTADSELWSSLKDSGDAYIYDAVKYGIPENSDLFDDLPMEVQNGFVPELEQQIVNETTSSHLWEIRKAWNSKAPQKIGLPTEIYRELIERRKRYGGVKSKIEAGKITSINDFITYNLNIRQFTQDHIEHTQDPVFIRHFYKALNKITILDPTCGSGAFLFAAMNILEPLYEGCINRMEEFTEVQPGKHKFFEETLVLVKGEDHPSLKYFIYKRIILNNLYGVDIMKEAVEIAKLRLFLKLVATVDVNPAKDNFGLEPLPDIDFNIRAGNTLVGFATENELLETINKKEALFAQDKLNEFKEEFELVSKAFGHFQNNQLINDQGSNGFRSAKAELNRRLIELNQKLNAYLVTNYGIDLKKKPVEYQKWLTSHQPFHWFAEFYQIVGANGGFDVIIGNPPYIEYSAVRKNYRVGEFKTEKTGNLYSFALERSQNLLHQKGGMSMIVPISSLSTPRMLKLQEFLIGSFNSIYASNFAVRPGKLFDGADMNLTVWILNNGNSIHHIHSTNYARWYSESREQLFDNIVYKPSSHLEECASIAKISDRMEANLLSKIYTNPPLDSQLLELGRQSSIMYYHSGGRYFRKCIFEKLSNEYKPLKVPLKSQYAISSTLSSSLFYWYWIVTSDTYHVTKTDVSLFPFSSSVLDSTSLLKQGELLLSDLNKNSLTINRRRKDGSVQIETNFFVGKSKYILDQIDTLLAEYYEFTEIELDFLINYDIKYRMGNSLFPKV